MLREWPMGLGLLTQRAQYRFRWPIRGSRAALGQSPTCRHHCFSVTATLVTFTSVVPSAVPKLGRHLSLSRGILILFAIASEPSAVDAFSVVTLGLHHDVSSQSRSAFFSFTLIACIRLANVNWGAVFVTC